MNHCEPTMIEANPMVNFKEHLIDNISQLCPSVQQIYETDATNNQQQFSSV